MLKKCGALPALLALTAAAALMITCSLSPTDSYRPPKGMGAVRLNFGETIQRTMLPNIHLSDFYEFELIFTKSGVPLTERILRFSERDTTNIDLEPGEYELDVTGYLGPDKFKPAAEATVSDIIITEGERIIIPVALQCITTGSGAGTYTWNIDVTGITDYETAITSATMDISRMDGSPITPAPAIPPLNGQWKSNNPVTLSVYSNYIVKFELTVNGDKQIFEHVLHIYQNLNTVIEYKFTDDYFGIVSDTVTVTAADWTYTHPEDYSPKVKLTGNEGPYNLSVAGTADDPIVLTGIQGAILTINNFTDLVSVAWYVNGDPVPGEIDATFTIRAGVLPFVASDTLYLVKAVGIKDGISYDSHRVDYQDTVHYNQEFFVSIE